MAACGCKRRWRPTTASQFAAWCATSSSSIARFRALRYPIAAIKAVIGRPSTAWRPRKSRGASARPSPRQEIPRDDWKLVINDVANDQQAGQLPLIELEVTGGLKPGWIYEVIYEAQGPLVQGTGLAGIRDIVSALKYGQGDQNPLLRDDGQPLINRAHAFGTSQSGRCLRHFLWDGFNADEHGRRVLDGVISHVAGGGLGFFNHRFASPTRTNGQHEEHLFPADYFPFTYGDMTDPLSGKTDGILRQVPRDEHRAQSLPHAIVQRVLASQRFAGPHRSARQARRRDSARGATLHVRRHAARRRQRISRCQRRRPVAEQSRRLHAAHARLVLALDAWVKDGHEPPPSVFPRIADGTLVGWRKHEIGWPNIPGVNYPEVIQQPALLDRGPHWDSERIATIEPPVVKGQYVVKVPALDPDGNERGTLNLPAITVPVATYTSWNLRNESIGAAGELLSLQGAYIPFPLTRAAPSRRKIRRPSLAERYRGYDDYERRYMEAAERLVAARYLLAEDLPRLKALCERFKPSFEASR